MIDSVSNSVIEVGAQAVLSAVRDVIHTQYGRCDDSPGLLLNSLAANGVGTQGVAVTVALAAAVAGTGS